MQKILPDANKEKEMAKYYRDSITRGDHTDFPKGIARWPAVSPHRECAFYECLRKMDY